MAVGNPPPASAHAVEVLFRRLRRLYWWSLGLALAVHLTVIAILTIPFDQRIDQVAEPARVKFFTRREPLLAKPLELRKVPQARRQLARRQLQASAARMDAVRALAAFDTRSLVAGPGSGASLLAFPAQVDAGPRPTTGLGPGMAMVRENPSRAGEHKIDMALEMLDINSMDTGRYRAVVVQDAKERQNLKGFVKLAHVMSASAITKGTTGWGTLDLNLVDLLRNAVSTYTGLQAEFIGSISYDDERLLEIPVVFPVGEPNESELENLTRYLLAGGFLLGNINTELQALLDEGLGKYGGLVQGKDFWTARVPNDHPVFSAFFDIGGGIPSGRHRNNTFAKFDTPILQRGGFLRGRLIWIMPNQGWGWDNHRFGQDSTRQLQTAVNIIIYALTQEGSMTQRLMQMVH